MNKDISEYSTILNYFDDYIFLSTHGNQIDVSNVYNAFFASDDEITLRSIILGYNPTFYDKLVSNDRLPNDNDELHKEYMLIKKYIMNNQINENASKYKEDDDEIIYPKTVLDKIKDIVFFSSKNWKLDKDDIIFYFSIIGINDDENGFETRDELISELLLKGLSNDEISAIDKFHKQFELLNKALKVIKYENENASN